MWDDPYEFVPFDCYFYNQISKDDNLALAAVLYTVKVKTYGQSWTSLPESDALWRIYDKKGTGIRISIKTSNISLLDDISMVKVKYYDMIEKINYEQFGNNNFEQLFAIKRKAFSHEKEVRLLSRFKYPYDEEEGEKYFRAFLLSHHEGFRDKYCKSNKLDVEQFSLMLDNLFAETNILNPPKSKSIPFSHILNFIDSVMLSPFAPDWFENTVSIFCKNNNIKFIGKSTLYEPLDLKERYYGHKQKR